MELEKAEKLYLLKEYDKALTFFKKTDEKKSSRVLEKELKCYQHLKLNYPNDLIKNLSSSYLEENEFQKIISILDFSLNEVTSIEIDFFENILSEIKNKGDIESFKIGMKKLITFLLSLSNPEKVKKHIKQKECLEVLNWEQISLSMERILKIEDVTSFEEVLIGLFELSLTNKNLSQDVFKALRDIQDKLKKNKKFKYINSLVEIWLSSKEEKLSPLFLTNLMEVFIFYENKKEFIYLIYRKTVDKDESLSTFLEMHLKKLDNKWFQSWKKRDKEFYPLGLLKDISENPIDEVNSFPLFNQELKRDENVLNSFQIENENIEVSFNGNTPLSSKMSYFSFNDNVFEMKKLYESLDFNLLEREEYLNVSCQFLTNLINKQEYELSIFYAKKIIENESVSSFEKTEILYLIAESYFFAKKYDKAKKYYLKVQETEPGYRLVELRLGSLE